MLNPKRMIVEAGIQKAISGRGQSCDFGHSLFSRSKVVVADCNTEHVQTGYNS